MGSAVLTNAVATRVKENDPSTNFNADTKLGTRTNPGANQDAIGYIYWTRPFPLGATILTAEIVFYTTAMAENVAHNFKWTRLNQTFSASKMTYPTRPLNFIAGDKNISKTGVLADKTEWRLNVADWMQTISNGGFWGGLKFIASEALLRYIYSENWSDPTYRPRLEVTWSDAPQAPSGLSPSGGRAVGLAKPWVKALFRDFSGNTTLGALQVQINSTDVWTSPSFDSGTVLTSVPELDLSTTAYAGLADGATVFWRIRFQDAAGVWSAWSASASFKRDDKGVLTVSNPPVGTPIVEDATPPIAWTFTGETQSAYQIQITHKVNNTTIVDWDTGKITGTGTSFTVPTGKINEPSSTTYTVTVRIWDNKQREATANDPTYVEVVRNFTFIPGATTGTATLTAVADAIRPRVQLTWTATTFPDRFNILRNGKIIAAALDPVNTFVSGTTHQYWDESPSPTRSLTYQVQRVVNNVASATNPTATVTVPQKSAVWLREPTSGLEIALFTAESPEFTLAEGAAVLQAIAPNANKVAINQSLGGLEGRIAGTLADAYGITAQQWRDNYLKMRDLRVKKFWLTIGDATFQVVAQEFTYRQPATKETVFDVSFMVYQQDAVSNLYLGS